VIISGVAKIYRRFGRTRSSRSVIIHGVLFRLFSQIRITNPPRNPQLLPYSRLTPDLIS